MKKIGKRQEEKSSLLISYQEAARCLGLTKNDVRAMVEDGRLHEVCVGGKARVAARSIGHVLGYDPFGLTPLTPDEAYSRLTFEQYAVKTLNHGVHKARSRTIENYRGALSLAAAELGTIRVAEITEEDLRRAFRRLAERYADSTLHSAYAITRRILQAAAERGDIPADPTRHWELPQSTKPRREDQSRVYTEEEIETILRTSRAYDRTLYTMFVLLACTGMRPGELLALEWSSYDRAARTIHIYQAVTRQFGRIRKLGQSGKSKSVLSVPKSPYSVRTLRLSDTAAEALDEWRARLRQCGNRAKARSRFIFPGEGGHFRSISSTEKRLQRYRAACGVQGVTFYKFRHTMCTRLVLEKQPISVIQRIMGDNSPDVIARVYTHIETDDALRAMDDLFASLRAAREASAALPPLAASGAR